MDFRAITQSLQPIAGILSSDWHRCLLPNLHRPFISKHSIYIHFIVYLMTLAIAHIMTMQYQQPIAVAARTRRPKALGSWIRITFEAQMSVCVCSVFVMPCVLEEDLRRTDLSPR
jgi:hypothetical protein